MNPEGESRSAERRIQWIAGTTLGFVMAGHVLLETASDTLFLTNVAVERLPLITIALALLALLVSGAPARLSHRAILIGLQGIAALGTFVLWTLAAASIEWSYYALPLWAGIVTSLIIVRFWLVLGELFTITQGKRFFAAIAMGGLIGALVGAGVAVLLAPAVGGQGLLIAATTAFAASAAGPIALDSSAGQGAPSASPEMNPSGNLRTSLRDLLENPYALRVALLVVVGGMTLTLGDYLFKSVLTEEVPSDQLAIWLSRIYLGLNLLSIGMLALGVTPLVRGLGVDRAIVVLPILIAFAGLGVLAGAALAATVFLKLSDGTLRYSLHRTASELLYLPMRSSLRASVKGAIDIVGQAGAKALASVVILGLILAPQARIAIALAIVFFAAAWITLALRLRQSYLDVFRDTLGDGVIETMIDHPELDLESVGELIRALSNPDERRALAAMQLLVERGQCALIPSLIVYHPSPKVVVQALYLFAVEARDDLSHLLDHLIDHQDAGVRAATVRATWAVENGSGPDLERLHALADSECLAIRASALAGLLSEEEIEAERFRSIFTEILIYDAPDPRLATATAARLRYHRVYREILIQLASDDDLEVAEEAIRAIRASEDAWFTAGLVELLGDRRGREGVRRALIERGIAGLAVLEARLVDPATPVSISCHIPRTIARFDTPEAADVLVNALPRIESGLVRYKLLRGLEWMLLERRSPARASDRPNEEIDRSGIRSEFERTLMRSLDLLRIESHLALGQRQDVSLQTVGGELLVDLMADKRKLSTGRLFMMLGLIHPTEDFRTIRTGLSSELAGERASAQELIETLLSAEVARGILSLAMQDSIAAQRALAGPSAFSQLDYMGLVRGILEDGSRSLRAVALYHAGEIGLSEPRSNTDRPAAKERGVAAVRELFDRSSRLASRMAAAK